MANATHLKARSLTVNAQEATNRAAVKIQELHIKRGNLQNYGQIESLKGNLSILMNDNALLNMENGSIHSKSNLSVFGVSTLTNKGIIKTYKKGLCTIEGKHFYNKGKIYHAGEFFSDMKEAHYGLSEWIKYCPPIKKRKFSIDSGFESDSDSGIESDSSSGRSRSSSFSSILSDCEYAEILGESLGNMSEFWSEGEEDSEQKNTIGEELVGRKPPARFPGRAVSSTSEALISPRGAGRSLIKTNPRFNVFRGPIKNAQHKASSTTTRTPSLPELRGGSEKTAPSPGFEDKLANLDSMSSLRDEASKNPISKSFETPEEQKIISSKLDNLLVYALEVLHTAGRKFSEIFFRKGTVYKFSMILWKIFLTFKHWFILCAICKHWFILCAICGLLLFGVRKVLLFFKDALEADV